MVVKSDKQSLNKCSRHWQVGTLCIVIGLLCFGIHCLLSFLAPWNLTSLPVTISIFGAQLISSSIFIVATLLLSQSKSTVYGITSQQLLQYRVHRNQLKMSTQILTVLSLSILAIIFTVLNMTIAMVALAMITLIFSIYHLNHTLRLCYDKKYMIERVQKLVDQSFHGNSKLEETYIIEKLCTEIEINNQNGKKKHLISDLDLLFYIYIHTEKVSIKTMIESKLEKIVVVLLNNQPLQLIMNEVMRKLETLNNKHYTKLSLILTKELLSNLAYLDKTAIDQQKLLKTLYTIFRPITDKEYLETLANQIIGYESLITNNNQLSELDKQQLIYEFYKTLTSFHYLPEMLKSLNLTCIVTIVLQKLQTSSQNIDLLLTALQESDEADQNMITYLIACLHAMLYAYDRKYHLPIIKDILVTLPTTITQSWSDLESHMRESGGIYLKYYHKIMEQIELIATQTNEPTFISYGNEFFLYYWFLQQDSTYSIDYHNVNVNDDILNNMIEVINYTQQQKYQPVQQFQDFYGYSTPYNFEMKNKIIDYLRSRYTQNVFDRQQNIQNEILKFGIDRICNKVNTYVLDHLNEIPFSKPNLNITDNNTFTLKFLITNEDLRSQHQENLLKLVNQTYQKTILNEIIQSTTGKLELKTFYYRNERENLSYITNWLDLYNCDCRTKYLSQNIDVLDNPKEVGLKEFANKEKQLRDVSKIQSTNYVYLDSDKVNIFNCPISTSIRELDQNELNRILLENKKGEYYQIQNFLSDKEDATRYYLLTYKMLELTYSMEIILQNRAGFQIVFGEDKESIDINEDDQDQTIEPIANQTAMDFDTLFEEKKEDH